MTKITFAKEMKREGMGPPSGMFFNEDILLLSDELHHRVEFFDLKSGVSSFFGKEGSGPGEFRYPKGVCMDSEGCFYVADCWNHRVQKFSPERKPLFSVGKYGDGPEEFNEPFSLTFASDGRLLVVDRCNHRIQIMDSDGKFHGFIGQRGTIFEEDMAELYATPLNLFSAPAFEFPNDLAFDSDGNLYVVDCNNHRIVKLDSTGKPLYAFGGKGSESGQFRFPHGITIDKNNILFVSDMNNERFQVFTPQGGVIATDSEKVTKMVECPTNITVTPSGVLYVTSGLDSSILAFDFMSMPVADIYTNISDESAGDQSTFFHGLFCLESGAIGSELKNVKEQIFSRIGQENCENLIIESRTSYHLLCEMIFKKTFDAEEAGRLLEKLGHVLECQNDKIKEYLKSRMEKGKELVQRRVRYEEAAQQKQEAFDTVLVRLLREDRDAYRAMRLSVLIYKRTVHLTRILMEVYCNRSGEGEVDLALLAGKNTRSILDKTLLLLEEREYFQSEREKYFKDESRSQKENWADFQYFSWCYDAIHQVVLVYEEICNEHLAWINTLLKKITPADRAIFTSELGLAGEGDSSLWDVVAKIVLLSACDTELRNLCLEDGLKSLLFHVYSGEVGNPIPEDASSDHTPENGVLFSVFHILLAESVGIDCQSFRQHRFYSEGRGDMAVLLKEIIVEIDEAVTLCQKGSLEVASAQTRLSRAPIKDESLKIPIIHRTIVAQYSHALALRSFVSTAMKLRLIGCELVEKRLYEEGDASQEAVAVFSQAKKYLFKRIETCQEWICNHYEVDAGIGEYKGGGEPLIRSSLLVQFNVVLMRGFRDLSKLFRQSQERADFALMRDDKSSISQEIATKYALSPGAMRELVRQGVTPRGALCYKGKFGEYGEKVGQLNMPTGIALDREGFLFVVEQGNHRVQKFTKDGQFVSCFGSFGFIEGRLNNPWSIAIDDDRGLLYVGDTYNNRVQVFSKQGEFIQILKPEGAKGFNLPVGIAVGESGVVSVVDHMNHRIVQFSADGLFLGEIGSEGKEPGYLLGPVGITVDSENSIYVGDGCNYRVQKLDSKGISKHCIGKKARGREGVLFPSDLTIGPHGDIYVTDGVNSHVKRIDKDFASIEQISEYGTQEGEVMKVSGLTSDDSSLYLCDLQNHRIQQWAFV